MSVSADIKAGYTLPPFVIETVSPDAMRDWSVFLADPNPAALFTFVFKVEQFS